MKNNNVLEGMACPNNKCRSEGPFIIRMKVDVTVTDDGYAGEDFDAGSAEWDRQDNCACKECGYSSDVGEFEQFGEYYEAEEDE